MSSGSLVNATVGSYRLVDFIGAGGMGEVYRAIDQRNRVVAVKVLHTGKAAPNAHQRFRNEARIHAAVRHPNIATMHEFLELNGAPCIVMEYVDGETIDHRIQSRGALPLSQALEIFERIVDAVGYLHSRGIIHRDLKANNVKVAESGIVKVLDFGIARAHDSPKLTVSGVMIGTPQYVAPEQLHGERGDERTDLWALGVLFYEMVTGRMPFEAGNVAALMDRVAKATYPVPSRVNGKLPREVDRVIGMCLKARPDQRYESAEALLADVRALSEPASATSASSELTAAEAPRERQSALRQRLPAIASMTAAGAAFVFLLYALLTPGSGNNEAMKPDTTGAAVGAAMPGKDTPATAVNHALDSNMREFVLTLGEGTAQVFADSGFIGTTPYTVRAALGQRIALVLRRNGYEDEVVNFVVTDGLSPRFTYYLRPRMTPPGPAAGTEPRMRALPGMVPAHVTLGAQHG